MHVSITTKEDGQKIKKTKAEVTFSNPANMFFNVMKETTQPLQLNVNFAVQH